MLLALYWSVPSVYTNSVARAYLLPLRGLDGAGEGGRSWPSISIPEKALPNDLALLVALCTELSPGSLGAEVDILSVFNVWVGQCNRCIDTVSRCRLVDYMNIERWMYVGNY